MRTIGFATEFYTLWDVDTRPKYFTDSYGNHHQIGTETFHSFIKNISTDLDKVKALYPRLVIDENLRGKSGSFYTSVAREEDFTPEILKFGKWSGRSIQEVAEKDFNYILWLLENGRTATIEVCKMLPKVIEYLAEVERKRTEIMASLPVIESGEVEIEFTTNPNHQFHDWRKNKGDDSPLNSKHFAYATIGEGNNIQVVFDEVVHVDGKYPYNMAIINGKPVRIKGKTIKLNLIVLHTAYFRNEVTQIAIIKK